jgi:DNA-binding response OmpR family regulator
VHGSGERSCTRARWADTGEHDRHYAVAVSHRPRESDRLGRSRREQHVRNQGAVWRERLVPELGDNLFREQPQILLRLDDHDARHPTCLLAHAFRRRYFVCDSAVNARVLVIDDEPDVRSLLRELLSDRGYLVEEARDGAEGLRRLYSTSPHLVLLDIAMPRMDGWQTLARIRELDDLPVLILTSRGAELEKVRGLRGGADDYVVKPFSAAELLARVEALLRRPRSPAAPPKVYEDGLVKIDYAAHRVFVRGREVALTPLEFRLLATFVKHPGQLLGRDQLLERVWHDPLAVSPDQVRLYVGYLRRKLGPDAPIETVRGFGYRYVPPAANA